MKYETSKNINYNCYHKTKVAKMKYITLLGFLTSLLPNKVEMLECYQCIDTKDFECVVNTTAAMISDMISENPDATFINLRNVSEFSECKDLQNKVALCDNSHSCEIVINPDLCGGVGT